MTDRDALLAAVIDLPEDDLPRLVFADWLEEHGEPARAAFIRTQIAAEALPPGDPNRVAMELTAAGLLREYRAAWDRELPEWVTLQDTKIVYRRGFADELSTTPRRLFRDGHELFAVAPVRVVRLRPQRRVSAATPRMFRAHEYYKRIVTLQLGPGLLGSAPLTPASLWTKRDAAGDPLDIYLLTESRKLTALRELNVSANELTDDWVLAFTRRFRRASFTRTLAVLDLSDNQITDAGADALGTTFDGVRLRLRGNRITPAGADRLRRRFGEFVEV
jgi:uncharacterized protein (TIGR02996 family)